MNTMNVATDEGQKAATKHAHRVARDCSGELAWKTIALAVISISLYVGISAASILGWMNPWFGFGCLAIVSYMLYTPMHESVHDNLSGKHQSLAWLNAFFGRALGIGLGASYTMHKAAHFSHHSKTNDLEHDPDNVFNARRSVLWNVLASTLIIVHEYKWYFQHKWPHADRSQRFSFYLDIMLIVMPRAAVAIAGYPMEAILFTVLPNMVGILITATFFSWLPHRPHDDTARYRNTVTYTFSKWLDTPITWLWLYQNYHSIHHLFPRIPFYRYREVYREIEPLMRAKHAPIVEWQN